MANDLNQLYITRERGWVGYNDQQAAEAVPNGYLADAVNCLIRTGEIDKRTGYSIIGSDLALSAPCQGLKGGQFANGTKVIAAVFNGSIYYWNGSGSFALATSGSGVLATTGLVDIVVAQDKFYFFDGAHTVPRMDSSNTVTTISSIPKGKYAFWFHNQLHVGGISGSPNTLASSDISAPETFGSGNSSSLDINPNDGDYITGLGTFSDSLIVFKRVTVWTLSGFGTTALTVDDIRSQTAGFGTLAHKSIINIGNALLYLGYRGDKPIIRALTRTVYGTLVDGGTVSDDIEGTMGGLNITQLGNCCAAFDGKFAWFALANGSSASNNIVLVYNTIEKGWTRQTGINASAIDIFTISNKAQMYFGESGNSSKVYLFDGGTSDNGANIDFSVSSRRYGGEQSDIKKKYHWLYLTAKETGNYTLTIDYSVDGFTFGNLGSMLLTGTGSIFDEIILDTSRLGSTDINKERYTIPKSRDYYAQFKIHDSSAVSSVTIKSWELYYYKKYPINTVHA